MVLTIYSALPPATNSSCHRHRRIDGLAGPGRARKTSADLTPATGARTTRLHRPRPIVTKRLCRSVHIRRSFGEAEAAPFVCAPSIAHRPKACPATTLARPTLPRPPHPVPTFVTMANALSRNGMARFLRLIWVYDEADSFSKGGWTRLSTNCSSGKSLEEYRRCTTK